MQIYIPIFIKVPFTLKCITCVKYLLEAKSEKIFKSYPVWTWTFFEKRKKNVITENDKGERSLPVMGTDISRDP